MDEYSTKQQVVLIWGQYRHSHPEIAKIKSLKTNSQVRSLHGLDTKSHRSGNEPVFEAFSTGMTPDVYGEN